MKTFESCNRVWLTMPEDGKCPVDPEASVRLLGSNEFSGKIDYIEAALGAIDVFWSWDWAGWYPVHADGTDDRETAKRFITESQSTPRPPRPRQIRRRFKLSTKRSILPP